MYSDMMNWHPAEAQTTPENSTFTLQSSNWSSTLNYSPNRILYRSLMEQELSLVPVDEWTLKGMVRVETLYMFLRNNSLTAIFENSLSLCPGQKKSKRINPEHNLNTHSSWFWVVFFKCLSPHHYPFVILFLYSPTQTHTHTHTNKVLNDWKDNTWLLLFPIRSQEVSS